MKNEYTRDVAPDMIDYLKEGGKLAPFIDFVKDNKDEKLALCFRGNDSTKGTVTIYKNNHCIWNLEIDGEGVPKVSISQDHVRFMDDWYEQIHELMNLGFHDSDGHTYDELVEQKMLVTRDSSKQYHVVKLIYSPAERESELRDVIKKSYEILNRAQHAYFNPDTIKSFYVRNPKNGLYSWQKRPTNYLKEYYFATNDSAWSEDSNHNFFSNYQNGIEKHAQGEIFYSNHCFENGFFIYDSEFSQPSMGNETIIDIHSPNTPVGKIKNEPDMLGIEFNANGEMEAICFIEVKSKKSSLDDPSGLEEHRIGMEKYLRYKTANNKRLMHYRKIEACRILEHYRQLKLYGVDKRFQEGDLNEDSFDKLKEKIMFVFTDEVIEIDQVCIKGTTIRKYLGGYGYAQCHLNAGKLIGGVKALIKEFPIAE